MECGKGIGHTLITVHINTQTIKNKHFSNSKSRKVLGFVDFCNSNTNISKNVYYTQSVDECVVEQKSNFQLAKMPKMNILKHLRNKYIN